MVGARRDGTGGDTGDDTTPDFDQIVGQPDPRFYFATLRRFDYCIPQLAKPYFQRLILEYRRTQEVLAPNILDIGCSYGINAALLKCDVTLNELYDWYTAPDAAGLNRMGMLARDRGFIRDRDIHDHSRHVGLDASYPALSYGVLAGFIDDAVHADLVDSDPDERQRGQLAGLDLVISAGRPGQVTSGTISRIIEANDGRRPWMAHFVVRTYQFDPVVETLAGLGYDTQHVDRVFKYRRFTCPAEQTQALDTLAAAKVDPRGLETDGWLFADLFVSRPHGAPRIALVDLAPGRVASVSAGPDTDPGRRWVPRFGVPPRPARARG